MFNNILLMGAASATGAGKFDVEYSCVFSSSDSPRLYRTPTVPGNRRTGSISLWYKRSTLSTIMQLFNAGAGDDITFNASDQLTFIDSSGVSYITTQVFRDTTAWGHLLFAWDTTLAAAGDRLRIYHNGVEITAFATETDPDFGDQFEISNIVRQTVGANESDTEEFDGYLSQFYYVDGQQLTPSSFGEFTSTNVWRPKDFGGGGSGIAGNAIPDMTSNTAPSGTASASAEESATYAAWKAFNKALGGSDYWSNYDDGVTGYLQYQFTSSKTITNYVMTARSSFNAPTDWTLEGSNNGSDYTTLDTVTGQTPEGNVPLFFACDTTGSYTYYKMAVTDTASTYMEIRELEMMEASSGYGTNGFKFDFADSADLGNDVSGKDNDYTSSGLDADDQVVDTPTNNFPTIMRNTSIVTMSEGNLQVDSIASVTWHTVVCTLRLPSTGKWCYEVERINNGVSNHGFMGDTNPLKGDWGIQVQSAISNNFTTYYLGYAESGSQVDGVQTNVSGLVAVANGGKLQMLLDQDAGTMAYWANGVHQKTWTGINIMAYVYVMLYGDTWGVPHCRLDFGQNGFTRVDEDYNYISTANFPAPAILDGTKNFQPTLYTGDGSVRNIDQTGNSTFQPDFVWIKNRSAADDHMAIDAARGVTKQINPDGSDVEVTDANGLTSFDSNGFGLGTGAGGYNDDTESFVAWQWKAGGGAGSSNEDGTINTTTTTVNTTAGISVGTYTGTGVAATIGHGLGVVPKMVIAKCRNDGTGAGQGHWYVYHGANTTAPETDYLYLNEAAATVDNATIWNDTAPTSTVFSIGTGIGVNESTNLYIYYAFAEIEGFSRFGNYIGNGNVRGAPAIVGFKPAYVMIKKTTGTGGWVIYDSQRSPYNEIDDQLFADTTAAETTGSEEIDFTALGFQIRTADSDVNTDNANYVYAAFAEHPFGGGEDVTPATTF